MSIFGSIKDAIFGKAKADAPLAPTVPVELSPVQPAAPAAPAPIETVDVEKILDGLVAASGRPSNWRVSIVDLMTLLGLDSSLANRRELAHELGYTGDTNDTATMNIWLHKQVMQKLAANGGKVPASLQ
ncbi:hypothetical protein G432_03755 [Sphingomonas sp. MM-1]|uniref:DUF3597 domain-containing protein n=1 Tax=Sphingomonas sp. MM-1 TaxID=745310 RepID=UPI0002C0B1A2|nr:DUF3597 domain-containing protein [Sphingomonas sp. MM-1]AGH48478.1 hypothetical protein G432_03755 [Sphingomonas sp. MM-1]